MGIIFGLIKQDNQRKHENENSSLIILHLPRAFYWTGIICGAIFCVILCFALFSSAMNILELTIIVAFTVLAIVEAVAASFWHLKMDKNNEYFTYTTSFGKTHDIKYDDITNYDINKSRLKFKVNNRAYYVDKYAVNFGHFEKMLKYKRKDLGRKQGDPVIISCVGSGWPGVVFLLAVIGAFFLVIWYGINDDLLLFSLICIGFVVVFLYLAIKGFMFRIYVYPNKSYILYRNIFGKTYEIYFKDILYVEFVDIFMKIKTKTRTFYFESSGKHNLQDLIQALLKNGISIKGKVKDYSLGAKQKNKK